MKKATQSAANRAAQRAKKAAPKSQQKPTAKEIENSNKPKEFSIPERTLAKLRKASQKIAHLDASLKEAVSDDNESRISILELMGIPMENPEKIRFDLNEGKILMLPDDPNLSK